MLFWLKAARLTVLLDQKTDLPRGLLNLKAAVKNLLIDQKAAEKTMLFG